MKNIISLLVALVLVSFTFQKAAGQFWQKTGGLDSSNISSLAIDSGGRIYASTDSTVFRSIDEGASWEATGFSSAFVYSLIIAHGRDQLAGTVGGIYLSTNIGNNWNRVDSGAGASNIASFAIDDQGNIFAGSQSQGISRSTDNGRTWKEIDSGLKDLNILTLIVPDNVSVLAGTQKGIYRSTNEGDSWAQITPELLMVQVQNLGDPNGKILAQTLQGIFCSSTDDGANWTKIDSGMTGFDKVMTVVINQENEVFAGTWGAGVYESSSIGEPWTEIDSGLGNTHVAALAVSPDGYIFAGTNAGVYRSIKSSLRIKSGDTEPHSFDLYQNYPNPIASSTTFDFTLSRTSFISLIVTDQLGKEMWLVASKEMSQGEHRITWDATNMASGLYSYRLEAEGLRGTMKLVILK